MYPEILKKLIIDLQKLPGIGEKTAERLALHLLTQSKNEDVLDFSDHLAKIKTEIKYCSTCHMITDKEKCSICENTIRDHQTIMIVADAKDVFSLEKMQTYNGVYHVLGNLIDFSRGITEQELNINTLLDRAKTANECIIATNSTVEGEMTAKFLKTILHDYQIKITRLAYGIPVGSDLKYADIQTLSKAVENRQKY